MEMRLFVRALLRWWFVPVVAIVVSLAGFWAYHRATDRAEAAVTVAVLQSYIPPPGEYLPAQIGFDALAESETLSERIAAKLADGTTPDQVRGWLIIEPKLTVGRSSTSLLYEVRVKHTDKETALRVANIAAVEAQVLFAEINTPDSRDVRRAFQTELDIAQGDVDVARSALVRFQTDNDAYALTQRRDQKLGLISQLQLARISATSGRGQQGTGQNASLSAAQGQLGSLLRLQPEYERLSFEVGLSQSAVLRLRDRVSDLEQAGAAGEAPLLQARDQLAQAEANFDGSVGALGDFQSINNVSQLDGAIQSQMALVNQLTVTDASSQAGSDVLRNAILIETAELQRLSGLEPQYSKLNLDLQRAETHLSSLQQKVIDVVAGRTLPASARALLLQNAHLQTSLIWLILTYALGVFVAVFVSVTAVYVLAYFEREPVTVEDIEREFGAPVIGRVARITG